MTLENPLLMIGLMPRCSGNMCAQDTQTPSTMNVASRNQRMAWILEVFLKTWAPDEEVSRSPQYVSIYSEGSPWSSSKCASRFFTRCWRHRTWSDVNSSRVATSATSHSSIQRKWTSR